MTSARVYHTDDCVLQLPEGFVDRTVNVLEWSLESGDNVILVVQRERLSETLTFDAYVAQEIRSYPSQFAAFHEEGEERASVGDDIEVRHIKFRWKNEQNVLYHHQVFVDAGKRVLVMTATGKASHRDDVDGVIENVLSELKFRED